MKRISLCLSIALAAMTVQLIAQSHEHFRCGVSAHDGQQIKAQALQNRKDMRDFVRPRNAVTYVPVRFHMVAESNGDGRPSEALALKALCRLNENYADQEIQFYLKEFKYFNNSTVYDNPGSNAGINAISGQMTYNAINVFVVDDAGGGSAAYYQLPYGPNGNDWIVAGDSYVDDVSTLTHEVGHFFTLNHPFLGWEPDGGWNLTDHGNPVTQTFAPDNDTPVELVDGSNCSFAGDGVCDTPADYGFYFPGNGCNMTEQVFDKNGDLLEPELQNFMNYADCNNYFFTDEQKDDISNSLFSFSRDYVRPNYTPNLDEVNGAATITTPADNETIETYNSVFIEWTAVPGADKYLVEAVASGIGTFRYVVENSTSMLATDLEPNGNYLTRVIAFNEYSTCANFSASNYNFRTGDSISDTADIPLLNTWAVQPNPVSNGDFLTVSLESAQGIKASVRLLTVTGQQVAEYPDLLFAPGISSFEIPIEDMTPGIYFVTLHSEAGMETRRVSIVD